MKDCVKFLTLIELLLENIKDLHKTDDTFIKKPTGFTNVQALEVESGSSFCFIFHVQTFLHSWEQ